MANQPSIYKQIIGARISRELYHKVKTLADSHGLSISELLVVVLEHETRNIELTAEQYEDIAKEIRAASTHSSPRQSRNQRKTKGKG